MKKQISSLLLACAVALVLTGCATEHHSTAWDYKLIESDNPGWVQTELTRLGGDGWVVVSSSSSAGHSDTNPNLVVILKRHK